MRAHFKPISGAYIQLGLETVRAMTKIRDSHRAASAECSEGKLNKIEALTETLSACLTVDPFVCGLAYDVMDAVLQGSKKLDIITFADAFAPSPPLVCKVSARWRRTKHGRQVAASGGYAEAAKHRC